MNVMGEPELAKLILEIPEPGCFVLDYEGNAQEKIKTTLKEFICILRAKHPKVPIIVVSCVRFANEALGIGVKEKAGRAVYQRKTVSELKARGDRNIYFVDGVHLTDLGFLRFADSIEPALRKALSR